MLTTVPEDFVVKCKLSTLMGERRLNVAQVARATGIHRNVVTRYYRDKVKQYDRDVITRLCHFFSVTPGELLVLAPKSE